MTDHATLKLQLPKERYVQPKWRFHLGFLEIPKNRSTLASQIAYFFQENNLGHTSASTRWEACKFTIHGWIKSYSALLKKKESRRARKLTALIHSIAISQALASQESASPLLAEVAILWGDLSQFFKLK